MILKVYCVHWSDHHRRWNEPRWIEQNLRELGLPFGYFLAEDQEKAKEFVKTLPPLLGASEKGYYPEEFTIGWVKIPDGVEALFKPE